MLSRVSTATARSLEISKESLWPDKLARKPGRPAKSLRPFSSPKYTPQIKRGPNRFLEIDEEELGQILALCAHGTTPLVAVMKILGVSDTTFYNWLEKAQEQVKAQDGDQRFADFFAQVGQAYAIARSDAENKVTKRQPLDALRYGPLGRPEWNKPRANGSDDDGDGSTTTLRVHIIVGRLGIKSEVVEDVRRLTEGESVE